MPMMFWVDGGGGLVFNFMVCMVFGKSFLFFVFDLTGIISLGIFVN